VGEEEASLSSSTLQYFGVLNDQSEGGISIFDGSSHRKYDGVYPTPEGDDASTMVVLLPYSGASRRYLYAISLYALSSPNFQTTLPMNMADSASILSKIAMRVNLMVILQATNANACPYPAIHNQLPTKIEQETKHGEARPPRNDADQTNVYLHDSRDL
jgi:hypothetical protein